MQEIMRIRRKETELNCWKTFMAYLQLILEQKYEPLEIEVSKIIVPTALGLNILCLTSRPIADLHAYKVGLYLECIPVFGTK